MIFWDEECYMLTSVKDNQWYISPPPSLTHTLCLSLYHTHSFIHFLSPSLTLSHSPLPPCKVNSIPTGQTAATLGVTKNLSLKDKYAYELIEELV